MNSADMATALIQRAKHLQEFVVETDVPEGFRFNGLVPFDMEIKNGTISATVYGIDFDEAVYRLNEYLETCK